MKKGCRIIMFAMAKKGRGAVSFSRPELINLENKSKMDVLTKEAWQAYLDCYQGGLDFLQSTKFNAILVRDVLV